MSDRSRLMAVFAHPDDDAWGIGGTVALSRDLIELTVVLATSGGAGQVSDPSLATPENLAEVREAEEVESMTALGVPEAPVHFLRYADGALEAADRGELVDRLVEIMAKVRPDVVVTFGPEGVTRHEDHIAIGEAATEAFHRARAESGGDGSSAAFRGLFYSSIPKSEIDEFYRLLRERGIDYGDPEGPFMPRGVPDETIAVRVDTTSVADVKLAGIKAHRTQWDEFGLIPAEMQDRVLGEECFVQAWPPAEPGGPVAESLLERVGPG